MEQKKPYRAFAAGMSREGFSRYLEQGGKPMLYFWNRREVYTGFSAARFQEIRSVLHENGVGYSHRLVSHSNPLVGSGRARRGSYGENPDWSIQYYIYVHRDDYERAKLLLGVHR